MGIEYLRLALYLFVKREIIGLMIQYSDIRKILFSLLELINHNDNKILSPFVCLFTSLETKERSFLV